MKAAAAVKKAGNPFNEMKKRSSSSETLQHNHKMMKRDKEEVLEDDNDLEDDDDDGEDFRKYWVDYDAFGYDKRALGSMRKRQQKPSNNDILIR